MPAWSGRDVQMRTARAIFFISFSVLLRSVVSSRLQARAQIIEITFATSGVPLGRSTSQVGRMWTGLSAGGRRVGRVVGGWVDVHRDLLFHCRPQGPEYG